MKEGMKDWNNGKDWIWRDESDVDGNKGKREILEEIEYKEMKVMLMGKKEGKNEKKKKIQRKEAKDKQTTSRKQK